MIDAGGERVWRVVEECHECRTLTDIKNVIRSSIRGLIDHEMSVVGIGDTKTRKVLFLCNVDYPESMMAELLDTDWTIHSPLFLLWLRRQSPQYISFAQSPTTRVLRSRHAQRWRNILLDFGVNDAAAHGLRDIDGRMTSYFSFGRLKHPMTSRDSRLLSMLIPHLHVSLMRIYGSPVTDRVIHPLERGCGSCDRMNRDEGGISGDILSLRELEVLKWVCVGKTNTEIGLILGISEYTAKNHIQNVLRKLVANSRAHAVAKAMSLGIVANF
ncbi:MAG: helix-turn-helix transcriptional regulator [Acidiferrobacteraceae bacterium]